MRDNELRREGAKAALLSQGYGVNYAEDKARKLYPMFKDRTVTTSYDCTYHVENGQLVTARGTVSKLTRADLWNLLNLLDNPREEV